MSKGTVVMVNARTGMFLVQIHDGAFAVFELLDSIEISIGDEVAGRLDALGSEELLHITQGERFDVFGQSGECSREVGRRLVAA